MHDNFYILKDTYDLTDRLLGCVARSSPDEWHDRFEQNVLSITQEELSTEPRLLKFVNQFKCNKKISIFQYAPYFNCGWHWDQPRNCSINMLLTGFNSLTMFGKQETPRNYSNITFVPYQLSRPILMNTRTPHSVLNFDSVRYLLSIGVPLQYTYQTVLKWLLDNDF